MYKRQDPDSAWTQSYLKAVQNFNSVRDIRYFSADTLRSMLETPIPGTDPQGIENLLNGHPYISDLFQQKQYGTDALISISVPVIQNDQVIGAFHSILNADLLVNVPNSDDEEYAQNFLVRRDGEIIPVSYTHLCSLSISLAISLSCSIPFVCWHIASTSILAYPRNRGGSLGF